MVQTSCSEIEGERKSSVTVGPVRQNSVPHSLRAGALAFSDALLALVLLVCVYISVPHTLVALVKFEVAV